MSTSPPLTFSTKTVKFQGDTKRIVLQNENGPCPLLAILNALILQGKLQLPSGSAKLDSSKLQHQLVGHIVDRTTALGSSGHGGDQQAANLRHQIDDTINLVMMGRFIEGMDVNLEFGDCGGFEYTRELAVFDLCGVSLLHGWIADAGSSLAVRKLSNMSYNEATLAVVGQLDDDPALVASLRSSLSASARMQLAGSLALSDAVPAIVDAIVSTSKLDNPPVSGGQEESISTQPSAATDASDVQDVVAAIVDRVAASAENRVPLSDVDPFSSTQQPQQAEPSNSAFQETEGLPGHAPASRSKSTEACTQVELIGIAQFLQDSQSQLTVSGLMQIAERMQAGNVAAFFRNNHFNTIYKHTDGALYVLVTDEGYSHEEGVVWERLCSEIGDTTYVSAEFEPYGVFQQKQVAEQEEALRQIRLAEEARLETASGSGAASNSATANPNDYAHTGGPGVSGTGNGSNGGHAFMPSQNSAAPLSATAQADADYAFALSLQQAEDDAARRYNPPDQGAQLEVPQSTLQGAVLPPQGGVPPESVPVHVPPHGRGGPATGAPPVNDGPRRFSGARQSGPVYVDQNPPQGGYSSVGHGGRPGAGRGRPQSSTDNCSIM